MRTPARSCSMPIARRLGGEAIGSPTAGVLGDRVGYRKVLIGAIGLIVVGLGWFLVMRHVFSGRVREIQKREAAEASEASLPQ